MKAVSVIGTVAMFMVGGGIIGHAFEPLHHLATQAAALVAGVPVAGRLLAAIAPSVVDAVAGVVVGAAVLLVVTLVQKVRGK
jgi:predicted DNA repair protein MutK